MNVSQYFVAQLVHDVLAVILVFATIASLALIYASKKSSQRSD